MREGRRGEEKGERDEQASIRRTTVESKRNIVPPKFYANEHGRFLRCFCLFSKWYFSRKPCLLFRTNITLNDSRMNIYIYIYIPSCVYYYLRSIGAVLDTWICFWRFSTCTRVRCSKIARQSVTNQNNWVLFILCVGTKAREAEVELGREIQDFYTCSKNISYFWTEIASWNCEILNQNDFNVTHHYESDYFLWIQSLSSRGRLILCLSSHGNFSFSENF